MTLSHDLARLRACLLPEPGLHVINEVPEDDGALIPAAVLFPIVLHALPTVLLTQRTAHLRDHPGQISFPGGRVEPEDRSPSETALREAAEEIGLPRSQVEIVGFLPEYRTGTGFRVIPVVGFVQPPVLASPDPFEVAEVFEVPLTFLLDATNHQRQSMHYRGRQREFYAMPYGERFIWGATAGMIRALYERIHGDS